MNKRIISLFLLLLLSLSLCFTACGENETVNKPEVEEDESVADISVDNPHFLVKQRKDGTLMLVGYKGNDTKLSIPTSISGYKVTGIGNDAFKDCSSLEEIVLPVGITFIGSNAFGGCTALKKINLPNTVETLRSGVFNNCTSLNEVTVPDSVKTINITAFDGVNKGFTIKCKKGSYAEVFAKSKGIKYIAE